MKAHRLPTALPWAELLGTQGVALGWIFRCPFRGEDRMAQRQNAPAKIGTG